MTESTKQAGSRAYYRGCFGVAAKARSTLWYHFRTCEGEVDALVSALPRPQLEVLCNIFPIDDARCGDVRRVAELNHPIAVHIELVLEAVEGAGGVVCVEMCIATVRDCPTAPN